MTADTVFFYSAITGSFVFGIKLILLLFGVDGEAEDVDSDDQFSLFSIQTISSFLMGFGWMGLAGLEQFELGRFISTVLATASGAFFVFTISFAMAQVRKLEQVNESSMFEMIGKTGTVYLTIPEHGFGQVQVEHNGALQTFDSTADKKIESFKKIEIIGVRDDKFLLVQELII